MNATPVRQIPIALENNALEAWALPLPNPVSNAPTDSLIDTLSRPLRDLRISVTDRCNFRCTYCMPRAVFGANYTFLPHAQILSFEEIVRVARLSLGLGVRKLRITGGEPLMRKGLVELIQMLSELRGHGGRAPELAMTTNGALLHLHAQSLRDAGLQRVTVSLDALDQPTFERMSDSHFSVKDVLKGIESAQRAGLAVKVNTVVQGGVNTDQILPIVSHFKDSGVAVRFIEFMDVGATNRWNRQHVVSAQTMQDMISAHHPLVRLPAHSAHDTAQRWAHQDGQGEVGFIASVTAPFCGDCSRLRLSTDGRLYTCLFAQQGYDLRTPLRDPVSSDELLQRRIAALWQARSDRYSELRGQLNSTSHNSLNTHRVEMSFIGG